MYLESKPLYSLTIGEFAALTRDLVKESLNELVQVNSKPNQTESEEHFDISGLAKFLRCSKVSIHAYKKRGLPFYRIGRKILFKKTEVLKFMQSLRNRKRI